MVPRGAPFPHAADREGGVEALVDAGHAGFLLSQPQPQRGQDGGCFLAQRLGVGAGAVHHDDPVVGIADQPPRAHPLAPAFLPLPPGAQLLLPVPGEVIIQRGQRDVGQQRGEHAPNAKGNFRFEATLGCRRLERGR
jgi:hypothetical protein